MTNTKTPTSKIVKLINVHSHNPNMYFQLKDKQWLTYNNFINRPTWFGHSNSHKYNIPRELLYHAHEIVCHSYDTAQTTCIKSRTGTKPNWHNILLNDRCIITPYYEIRKQYSFKLNSQSHIQDIVEFNGTFGINLIDDSKGRHLFSIYGILNNKIFEIGCTHSNILDVLTYICPEYGPEVERRLFEVL